MTGDEFTHLELDFYISHGSLSTHGNDLQPGELLLAVEAQHEGHA